MCRCRGGWFRRGGGGGFAKFIALNIINVRAMRVAVQFVRKPNNLLCSERGFCVSSGRGNVGGLMGVWVVEVRGG